MDILKHADAWILAGFFATVTVWLGLALLVLLNRAIHDLRFGRLTEVRNLLQADAIRLLPPAERSNAVIGVLERFPRRVVDRILCDLTLPGWLIETFAALTIQRSGMYSVKREASSHRGFGKWRRIAALSAVAHARVRGFHEVLELAIFDPDDDVTTAGVVLLSRAGDSLAAEILLDALIEQTGSPSRIATQLDQFPIPIFDLLVPLLKDARTHVRYWAAALLSRYPEAGAGADLVALTHDAEPTVRKIAIRTLGATLDPRTLEAAPPLLTDSVDFVRTHAARALALVAARELPERRRRFAGRIAPLLGDKVWHVRQAAKESLVQLGSEIWPEVAAHLESKDAFARNGAAEVLQNLGVVDQWIDEIGKGASPSSEVRFLLERTLRAGGPPLVSAAAARSNPAYFPSPESLVARLRMIGVGLSDDSP